jgi:predicted RNase H-like HicB family nuclease
LHVRIHRDRGRFWAQVREWPGCFAAGDSWEELTEAIEEAVGLCMAARAEEGPAPVSLRIRGIDIEVDADMPLIRALADKSVDPLRPWPRTRDPHPDWPLREFGSREKASHAIPDEAPDECDECDWEDVRASVQPDEHRVAAYERIIVAEERLYQLWEQGGEGMNWVGEAVGSPIETNTVLWVMELGEKVAALGGQLELAAVFPDKTVTLLLEPGALVAPQTNPHSWP